MGQLQLWKAARYAILAYFSILILPFLISRYLFEFAIWLTHRKPSLAAAAADLGAPGLLEVPELDNSLSGYSTPRSSGEWEAPSWEPKFYSSVKYHRNLHETQHPFRLWEDDDGYGTVGKRGFGVIYEED